MQLYDFRELNLSRHVIEFLIEKGLEFTQGKFNS